MIATPGHASLADQLAPVAPRVREVRARIRPVSQSSLSLGRTAKGDRFATTVDAVLRWANNRAGRRLPEDALRHRSFEMTEVGTQRLAAVAMPDPRIWALRLDDADKNVPLRTWVTEVGVGAAPDGQVLFATRLICATRGEDAPFERTVPGFVKQVIDSGPAFLDGRAVGVMPWVIGSEAAADDLVELLESPERRAPVVVFALPEKSEDPSETAVPIGDFISRTAACAHTCVLTGPASFHLTDRLGKELSVFRRAVRNYLPGFKRWRDQPYRHPLWLPDRVAAWPNGGSAGYLAYLIDQVLESTVQSPDREDELPSFTTIRQAAARSEHEHAKRENRSDKDLLNWALQENQKLESDIRDTKEKYAGLIDELERRRDEAEQQAQEARAQNFALRERVRALERKSSANAIAAQTRPAIPDRLDEFQTWCHEHLSGAVELHNRAYQGVKKSVFKDPTLIYEALLLLRDRYVPMRQSNDPALKTAYDAGLRGLHLEDSTTGAGWKQHPEQYVISYDGKPRRMDRHLKQGTSHDPAHAFRLYYFWDDESQVVVVGWLPSHLDNAMT
ncbi:MAG: hypothetical protein J0L91_00255 [Burkholderiales bacterium]|nr:hypothetical protein [Burkholderiales bacterium]